MSLPRSARIALRWGAVVLGLALGSAALLLVYGVGLVDRGMAASQSWSCTRVLSAPLVLRPGDRWSVGEVAGALRARGIPERAGARPGAGEFALDGSRLWLGAGLGDGVNEELLLQGSGGSFVITDASGRRAFPAVTVGPAVVGTSAAADVVRWPVRLETMAPSLLTAVVDTEDRTFLSHSGLSLRGLLRATVRDLVAGGARQGGSTITQQLAKILLLRPVKRVERKVVEAWLASLIEYRYDKRSILQAYLNRAYFGQDGGWQIQGVEAASHYYFGKRARNLKLDESALLAGMIAAPNRFDPFAHPDAARQRRAVVLTALLESRHVEVADARSSAAAPLPVRPHRLRSPMAVHFSEQALARSPASGDLLTTLDPALQAAVKEGCEIGCRKLEERHPRLRDLARAGSEIQSAVVILALDGRVLALQGSRTGAPGEFDRAVAAHRQVGSLVKPFTVVTGLRAGWSLDATLDDAPLAVPVGNQIWSPENSDGRYRGPVSVREALVSSLNVPMVRLGLAVSVAAVADQLRRVGLTVPDGRPAILLGAFEATPLEVARAYTALLARGRLPGVALLAAEKGAGVEVIEPWAAHDVVGALTGVVQVGTAAMLAGRVEGPLAAKTGTTDARRDSWFVALRPRHVTVVWVGTDSNEETGLFGATGALEVWREIDARIPSAWRWGEPGA